MEQERDTNADEMMQKDELFLEFNFQLVHFSFENVEKHEREDEKSTKI